MAIRPLGVNFDFVLLVLKTMGLKFQAQAVGIAIPGIGREDVAGSLVALPPFAEQLRIVTRVNEIRGLCAGLRQSLASVQTAQLLISNVLIGSFNNFLNPTETNGLSN
jgi:type I restriction enzyme S subunit